MVADSTAFQEFFSAPKIYIPVLVALLSAGIALFAAFPGWLQYRKQRRKEKLLEREFGAELYPTQVIQNSTRYYIPPDYTNIDPAHEAKMRQAVPAREPLFDKMDALLRDDVSDRHFLLLADSGMGKSSFVLNYYARNQELPEGKRRRIALVPLGIPNADEHIQKIPQQNKTILFLDAFDEDAKAIADHKQRLRDLMALCENFERVVLTCRTQFFPREEEIPKETGIARVGPRRAGEGRTYEFWKLYLAPFTDPQVESFIRKRWKLWQWRERGKTRELMQKAPLLSVRPMLMAYIPDLLKSQSQIQYSFQLYEILVEKWYERERGFVEKEVLRQFSELMAVDIYLKRQERSAERVPREELKYLAEKWDVALRDWQLGGRSLLNRDAQNNYKFAHRSIMEYLFLKQFIVGNQNCRDDSWTSQMKRFFLEMLWHDLQNNQKVSLDISHADLSGIVSLFIKPIFQFRTEQRMINKNTVKSMLNKNKLFDSRWNQSAKGIFHLYELIILDRKNVVFDATTGLMWQQAGSSEKLAFANANRYVEGLNHNKFAGFDDWRLPTVEEAMSLMKPLQEEGDSYIDPIFHSGQPRVWTIDKTRLLRRGAWYVNFFGGYCNYNHVDYGLYVRGVRSR